MNICKNNNPDLYVAKTWITWSNVNIVPTRFDLRLQSKEVLESEGESEN